MKISTKSCEKTKEEEGMRRQKEKQQQKYVAWVKRKEGEKKLPESRSHVMLHIMEPVSL